MLKGFFVSICKSEALTFWFGYLQIWLHSTKKYEFKVANLQCDVMLNKIKIYLKCFRLKQKSGI